MRVLITGGPGLIGAPLAASLAGDGHDVIFLTRNPGRYAGRLPKGVRAHPWDARTAGGWLALADGAGAIVNLAGESIAGTGRFPSRWTDRRKEAIYTSRVYAGLAVVDAVEAAARKPQVVIQASAVGYYGQREDDVILSEQSAAGDDFLGKTCVAWEKSTAPVEEMGVRRCIVRTGLVLANQKGSPLPLAALPFRFFAGGPLGSGDQYWPWIHIHDEVAAIRFLIENEKAAGPFNLTAPNPTTNREFAAVLGRVLQRPSFVPAPGLTLRLALGEIATLVLDGQRAVPHRLLDLGFKFRYAELFYALRDLLA
jgi:hypothetical protein